MERDLKTWMFPLLFALVFSSCSHTDQSAAAEKAFYATYTKHMSMEDFDQITIGKFGTDKIEGFRVALTKQKTVDIQQARTLMLAEAHRLLYMANHDKALIPFLRPHPLKLEDIELTISFVNKQGGYPPPPSIAECRLADDTITFIRRDPINNTLKEPGFSEKLVGPKPLSFYITHRQHTPDDPTSLPQF